MAVTLIDTAEIAISHTSVVLTVPAGGVPSGATVFVYFTSETAPASVTLTDTGGNTYTAQLGSVIAARLFRAFVATPLAELDTITIDYNSESMAVTGAVAFYATGVEDANAADFALVDGTSDDIVGPVTVPEDGIAIASVHHFNTVLTITQDPTFTQIGEAIAVSGGTRRGVTVSFREAGGTYSYDPALAGGVGFRALTIAAYTPAAVAGDGFWADGFWADGFWAPGFWDEGAPPGPAAAIIVLDLAGPQVSRNVSGPQVARTTGGPGVTGEITGPAVSRDLGGPQV